MSGLNSPAESPVSGWVTAFFPEVATVGGIRDLIRAGSVCIPEDVKGIGEGAPSDPFRRDVYLLGVIAYYLLYLTWPQKQGEIAVWTEPEQDPYGPEIGKWLAKALELLAADRYANARVMLEALNAIPTTTGGRPGLDMKDFEPYRSEVLPIVAYPIEENIKQGRCHLYKSSRNGQPVAVKIWYGLRPDPRRPEETHQILRFLERARLFQAQRCTSSLKPSTSAFRTPGRTSYKNGATGIPLARSSPLRVLQTKLSNCCKRLIEATQRLHGLG